MARNDRIEIFCSFAMASSDGVKVNTQLNTNSITKTNNTVAVLRRVLLACWSVNSASWYSRCWDKTKEEMAGEWLKEKTNTGIVIHKVVKNAPALGILVSEEVFHSGIRYTDKINRINTSGYTSYSVTFKTIRSPNNSTPINEAIKMNDNKARGGEAMPSWLTRKESTVLVMPLP